MLRNEDGGEAKRGWGGGLMRRVGPRRSSDVEIVRGNLPERKTSERGLRMEAGKLPMWNYFKLLLQIVMDVFFWGGVIYLCFFSIL